MSGSNSNNKDEDDVFGIVCQNLRRFRDQHISSVLHSLIGLPSILAPPTASTWVIVDDDLPATRAPQTLTGPDGDFKKSRAYSEGDSRVGGQTMKEIASMNANWMAQRTGGGSGIDGNQANGQSRTDASASAPPGSQDIPASARVADPTSPRSVYVFRFLLPPSPLLRDGISDPPSALDVFQHHQLNQTMNYYDPLTPHSFFLSELQPAPQFHFQHQHSPFFPLFGFPHSFMFNPLWSLLLLTPPPPFPAHDRPEYSSQQQQRRAWWDDDQFLNPFSLFDDALRSVWDEHRRLMERENLGQKRTVDDNTKNVSTGGAISEEEERTPAEDTAESAETELDAYEFLDSLNKQEQAPPSSSTELAPPKSTETPATSSSPTRVIGTSTIMKSHTLPDGSTFTKTIKIRRFEDGTEQRIENEHTTPPSDGSSIMSYGQQDEYDESQTMSRKWGFEDDEEDDEVEDLWDVLMGRSRRRRNPPPPSSFSSTPGDQENHGHNSRGGGILEKLKTIGKDQKKDGDLEKESTAERTKPSIISKD
ncbi:hypothetical protein DFH27DRAFT_615263 [Peziza echinospora]|nr:hypothetical protein DFH27DRAFT_615263 [Peziza echinospora]